MRWNDVFFVKSGEQLPPCNFVTVQFTKQTWNSTAFGCNRMCPNGDRKFQIHSLGRAEGSFVFIHLEVRFCQQPRTVSNLNPSVIHFLFVSNNIIPISFSLPLFLFPLSLFLIRSPSPLLYYLYINILPRPNEYFLAAIENLPSPSAIFLQSLAVVDSLSRVNTKHASRRNDLQRVPGNNENKFLSRTFRRH